MRDVLPIIKDKVRFVLALTNPGYRLLLRISERASGPTAEPMAPWHNAVLKNRQALDEAVKQVKRLGLPVVADTPKNWDTLAALDCILSNTSRKSRILDAGAETYSRILPWLSLYRYEKLDGINIVFTQAKRLGPITYRPGDITCTDYQGETFDAIACLSVIEHGIDLTSYFKEAARILKPGGVLITSTDYWQSPIDTRGQQRYGAPVRILTTDQIRGAIELAARYGLGLTSEIDFTCQEKVVHWEELDLEYTFIIFTMRKL